jgi:hypothetical protein
MPGLWKPPPIQESGRIGFSTENGALERTDVKCARLYAPRDPVMLRSIMNSYKEAIAVAYVLLSLLGYAASTIFYLQVGIWYPSIAGLSDYFLAAIQDFYGIMGLILVASLSVAYYVYGAVVEFIKKVIDTRFRRAIKFLRARDIYFDHVEPRLSRHISSQKAYWKLLLPFGAVVSYGVFPYLQGRALAESPERYVSGPNGRPLIVRSELGESRAFLIGTTSEYVILLDASRSQILIYRRDGIRSMRSPLR